MAGTSSLVLKMIRGSTAKKQLLTAAFTCFSNFVEIDRACNGMEWKMEWKRNFGMEYGRFQVWKGMEDFKNGMECHLPYFPYLD